MSFGRLERSVGAQPMSDINVTPLVDIMLVLVVILIVTAPLLASSLQLQLPKSSEAQSAQAAAVVAIGLDRAGRIHLDDKPSDDATVLARMQRAAQQRADTEVHLRADEGVPYGRVVEVMGLAQKAGLQRVAFIAESKSARP